MNHDWLENLRKTKGGEALKCKNLKWRMEPFKDGLLDPFLQNFFYNFDPSNIENIKHILVLQDWWSYEKSESENNAACVAREYLSKIEKITANCPSLKLLRKKDNYDATLYSLVCHGDLLARYRSGETLIMNAVPGLRHGPQKKPCGYLGARIHKIAFEYWGKILALIINNKNSPTNVYLCGSWADFDGMEKNHPYTGGEIWEKWSNWVSSKNTDDCKFNKTNLDELAFYLVYHPAIWRQKRDETGDFLKKHFG